MKVQVLLALVLSLSLAACAGSQGPAGTPGSNGADGTNGTNGATGATGAAFSPADPAVAAVAAEFPTNINPGINCTVQQVTGGTCLSTSASTGCPAGGTALTLTGSSKPYTQTAGFNQPNSSSGPNSAVASEYQYLLTAWVNYKISCSGYLVITEAAAYDFDVNSDDGSILTVSGLGQSFTVGNDGTHAMTDKFTSLGTWLYPGVYNFNLQYAQSGGGNFGLIVSWYQNNVEAVIPAGNFYH